MKLNIGCGFNKFDGLVNVDKFDACQPDLVMDAEILPWPFADNSVSLVLFNHSLEHMGASTEIFLGMMKELYRVCEPGALIQINVPHPRHNDFIGDPTHVRPITPEMLYLFNKRLNEEWRQVGAANSSLGIYLNVDFQVEKVNMVLDSKYREMLAAGSISNDELAEAIREKNNVVSEFEITMRAVK